MSELANNPIALTYTALLDMYKSNRGIASMVKRFVNMTDSSFNKFIEELGPNDTPELTILAASLKVDSLTINSKASGCTVDFLTVVTFSDLKLFNPLVFLYYIVQAYTVKLAFLQNNPAVRDVTVDAGMYDPFGKPEWTRRIERQLLTVKTTVTYNFSSRDLILEG